MVPAEDVTVAGWIICPAFTSQQVEVELLGPFRIVNRDKCPVICEVLSAGDERGYVSKLECEQLREVTNWLTYVYPCTDVIDQEDADARQTCSAFVATARVVRPRLPFGRKWIQVKRQEPDYIRFAGGFELLPESLFECEREPYSDDVDFKHLATMWSVVQQARTEHQKYAKSVRALQLYDMAHYLADLEVRHIILVTAIDCLLVPKRQSSERQFVETIRPFFEPDDTEWCEKTKEMYRLRGAWAHGKPAPPNLSFSQKELCIWAGRLARQALQKVIGTREALEKWGRST